MRNRNHFTKRLGEMPRWFLLALAAMTAAMLVMNLIPVAHMMVAAIQ
jgi:hypothetical protein